MSSSINIGCTSCGHTLTLNPPDSIHTEANRFFRVGMDSFDFILMNAKCVKCNKINFIF